jgi:hypothetical protein
MIKHLKQLQILIYFELFLHELVKIYELISIIECCFIHPFIFTVVNLYVIFIFFFMGDIYNDRLYLIVNFAIESKLNIIWFFEEISKHIVFKKYLKFRRHNFKVFLIDIN